MDNIEQDDLGFWWPTSPDPREIRRRAKRLRDARVAAAAIAGLCPRRGLVIQAGGHVGLWPLALAPFFTAVVTCEPDLTNCHCLTRNVSECDNVLVYRAALRDVGGTGRVVRTAAHQHLSGAGYVVEGTDVVCLTVDDLAKAPVSALVLDVEGGEYLALAGAAATLQRDHPLVVVEADVFPKRDGVRSLAAIGRYLAGFGYGHWKKFPLGAHNFYFAP